MNGYRNLKTQRSTNCFMNKIFVRTQNVKNFIGLVEILNNKPKNIPKMGLIYGEPGLGKSQTALWLACKYDGIYLRCSNLMTGRWLVEDMVKEMDEIPRFLTSDFLRGTPRPFHVFKSWRSRPPLPGCSKCRRLLWSLLKKDFL